MSDERNWFDKFALCMDQNIRGVQYGVYSVALVGLAVALRSVRPFKKFCRPHDIPSSFVEKHITLRGRVVYVEPAGNNSPPLLMVDHSPIISLSWLRPQSPYLPVHVSSVDITSNGVSWLQLVVVGSDVKFTVLKLHPDFVSCIVRKEKKNLGLELVSLGFATVSPLDFALEKDPVYIKYYQKLLDAENKAEKKGSGMWATTRSPVNRLWNTLVIRTASSGLSLLKELLAKQRRSAI
ncbi:protein C3orf33 homolog [Anabrus simplex]|uniref:protein C3orf33 homolog n=1 Tax=Anabrus simplex TaxID=316456 RepID=UPI0034DCD8FF